MAKDAAKESEVQTPDEATADRAEIYSGPAPENTKMKDGDAGTYAGEYKPAATEAKPEARKDLPRGYVPGAYSGGYTSSDTK